MLKRLFQWRHSGKQQASDHLQQIVSALDALGHPDIADEVSFYANTEADTAIRVTVFGEYSVGKSTLINALLGKQVLAASLKPTTGVPTEVRYGMDKVRIVYRDGRSQAATLAEASSLINLGVENRARDEVERIIISTTGGVLKPGLALIDTPGVLDADLQTERAKREVAAADVVMLVLRADHMLSNTERSLSLEMLTKELGKPIVPVINFLGLTDANEHGDLRAILQSFAKGLIRPFGKPWFEVDALPALRYRLGIEGAANPQDDYDRLSRELRMLAGKAARIKRKTQSRDRWRESWQRRAFVVNHETLSRLNCEAESLISQRRRAAENLQASLRRLGTNRAGDKSRCLAFLDQHCTGRINAIEKSLPGVHLLKTEAHRKDAFAKAGCALERALVEIDDNANLILATMAEESAVVLEPVSLRELAALEIPPDAAINGAIDGAGGVGLVLLGGLAFLAGGWIIAIPAAIIGLFLGRNFADNTKEIEEFRMKLSANLDAQLTKLRPLLASQFDARVDNLKAAIEIKLKSVRDAPLAKDELKLREDLTVLLHNI